MILDLKVECHQISSLSHFVAFGMGVSAIPRRFQNFIDQQQNVLIELVDGEIPPPVGIIYQKDAELSNASAEFINTMLRHHF